MSLRALSLAFRFLLVIFIAKFLTISDVGLFGIVAASVSFVLYIVGLDMYAYTNRELIKSPKSEWKILLGSHTGFLIAMQLVVLPLCLFIFTAGILPWKVAPWFFILVVLELFGTELDRVLIAVSKNLSASILIFIRLGLLPIIVIPCIAIYPQFRDLNFVFNSWVITDLVAIFVGAWLVSKASGGISTLRFNIAWLKNGLSTSLILLFATLLLRAIFSLDRQIVAYFGGLDTAGLYIFAMGIAAGITSFVDLAFTEYRYPKMVKEYSERNFVLFEKNLSKFLFQVLVSSIVIVAISSYLLEPMLHWVGKEELIEQKSMILIAISLVAFYNLSLVPHQALYAMEKEKEILISTVIASLIWFITWTSLVSYGILFAMYFAFFLASFSLLVAKTAFYIRAIRRVRHQ